MWRVPLNTFKFSARQTSYGLEEIGELLCKGFRLKLVQQNVAI
jgi:hypothetical protein